ncbi:MAG TPA: septal ring lytic transglycosylase RlpA family protein [Candidatus Latescibacteria bacterium]|nr:septal ring lytic transglycosylase RlpA family protein [Candidatus Latescibacterota bacterium]
MYKLVLIITFSVSFSGCVPAPRFVHKEVKRDDVTSSGVYQVGVASYYGREFHGRPTSSGEIFDMFAFTAAHRNLPFGTRIKVTNLDNGRWVVVRVNDRGPFVEGRILDLSYAAAKKIGMISTGTARVRIEIISR